MAKLLSVLAITSTAHSYLLLQDTDYFGGDMFPIQNVNKSSSCLSLCERIVDCKLVTWYKDTCYIKNVKTTSTPKKGCVTYDMYPGPVTTAPAVTTEPTTTALNTTEPSVTTEPTTTALNTTEPSVTTGPVITPEPTMASEPVATTEPSATTESPKSDSRPIGPCILSIIAMFMLF